MSRDPAYLYYFRNFMAATQTWEDAEVGAYQRALNCQADQWSLSEPDLRKILNTSWDRVSPKFKKDDNGRFFNQRLRDEMKKRENFSKFQSEKAAKRWNKTDKPLSGKKVKRNAGGVPGDMPNRCTRVANANIYNNNNNINNNISLNQNGSNAFERFWKMYPRKVGKGKAEAAWKKIKRPYETLNKILVALSWQKATEQWTDQNGRYIPHPATYLNQRRWEDEPIEPADTGRTAL